MIHFQPMCSVVLDTDAGADDVLAMYICLRDGRIRLHTTLASYGAYPLDESKERLRRIFKQYSTGNTPPLIAGSSRPLSGTSEPAYFIHGHTAHYRRLLPASISSGYNRICDNFRFSRIVSRMQPDTAYVCIGPLTNLATLIRRQSFVSERVIIMGGAIDYPGNATELSEANFFVDPHAAKEVLGSKLPIELIPLNVTNRAHLDLINHDYGDIFSGLIREYFTYYSDYHTTHLKTYYDSLSGSAAAFTGGAMHDVVPIIYLLEPRILTFRFMTICLDEVVKNRGFIYACRQRPKEMCRRPVSLSVAVSLNMPLFASTFRRIIQRCEAVHV